MGEEAVQMQQQQQQEEAKVEEMKLEEPKPCPCPPIVLLVDLHCSGCAKKIEKCIMRIRGVERVSIDMAKNEVTIKGIVDPDAVCAKITTKTKRVAKVLSPSPPLPEGEPSPHLIVNSQLKVVELNVNMHCDACAHQLKKKILKMRGVQTASTELSTGKVVVTGTMDGDKLVDYVYRRTKKQARIVPQPQPTATPPEQEPLKPEQSKEEQAAPPPPPPPPPEEIKTEDAAAPQAQGTDTNNNNKEEVQPKAAEEGGGQVVEATAETKPNVEVEEAKAAEAGDEMMGEDDHESMKRMMYQYYQYQPLYVMERIPPPQLFSDENPNACCVL